MSSLTYHLGPSRALQSLLSHTYTIQVAVEFIHRSVSSSGKGKVASKSRERFQPRVRGGTYRPSSELAVLVLSPGE